MGTVANVLVGNGTLSVKAPHSGSWVDAGFTKNGASISHQIEYDTKVPWFSSIPTRSRKREEVIVLEVELMEATIANLKAALAGYDSGSSTSSKIIISGANQEFDHIGFKIVGNGPGGTTRTVTIPYALQEGESELEFIRTDAQRPILALRVKDDGTNDPITIEDV